MSIAILFIAIIAPFLAFVTSRSRDSETDDSHEAGPSTQLPKKKKGRGRTRDHPRNHPPHDLKFEVIFDDTNQATDEIGRKLLARMAQLAKDNTIFPIDVKWLHQAPVNFQTAWKIITSEFDLSQSDKAKTYINNKLNKLWRTNHNTLMAQYGSDPNALEQEIIDSLPPYVNKEQFLRKLRYVRSDKGKAVSEQNKKNRAQQKTHHVGSKGMAQRRHQYEKEGLSATNAWASTMCMAYPYDENPEVKELVDFVKSDTAQTWAETESMSQKELIKSSLTQKFGENKKNRIMGMGEAASMVSTTNERFSTYSEKGKKVASSDDSRDDLLRKLKKTKSKNKQKMSEMRSQMQLQATQMKMMMDALQNQGINIPIASPQPSTSRVPTASTRSSDIGSDSDSI